MYFQGFPAGKTHLTPLPEAFFSELLPRIESLAEMKVTLYSFYRASKREGNFRFLEEKDYLSDETFLGGLDIDLQKAALVLAEALRLCVRHGILLEVILDERTRLRTIYFINTARGRAAAESARTGKWSPPVNLDDVPLTIESKNIFRLYEENIGALTPLMADMLRDAEQIYSPDWVEQAFQIAVARNARNWRYVEAILRGWQERGHDETQARGDSEADRRKYVEGKYADFINH